MSSCNYLLELLYGKNRVKVFEGYRIIDGFKVETIKMEPYSFIDSNEGHLDIGMLSMDPISLWIETSRGSQHVRYKRMSALMYRFTHRNHFKWMQATVIRESFNDKIVMLDIKYALYFTDSEGELHTIFIHKSGMMSNAILGYNSLPKKVMKNEKSLCRFFDINFEKEKLVYRLKTFNDNLV